MSEAAKNLETRHNARLHDDKHFAEFCQYLEASSGITLGVSKQYLVNNRLRPIMNEYGFDSLDQLVNAARSDTGSKLSVRVINAMTTNETSWFRDDYPFECLKEEIFPQMHHAGVQAPRIWSAACSYGHEPFSLSITVEEYLEKNPGSFPGGVEIVGTDISTQALDYAREAQYDELNLSRGLSSERRNKYFTREGESSHVVERVRQRVKFFELNLLKSIYLFGKFDIVFCRNVLIYFSNENKSDILSKIETSMKPDAWLFLGASEPMMNYSDAFRMVKFPRGVAYQKKS